MKLHYVVHSCEPNAEARSVTLEDGTLAVASVPGWIVEMVPVKPGPTLTLQLTLAQLPEPLRPGEPVSVTIERGAP